MQDWVAGRRGTWEMEQQVKENLQKTSSLWFNLILGEINGNEIICRINLSFGM